MPALARSRGPARAALLASLALLAGCADGPTAFRAIDRVPSDAQPLRLTYSPGDDRAPFFSAGGDSIGYAAEDPDALPPGDGILVAVPAGGGPQRPLLPSTTPPDGARRWFTAPALAPGGDRLAYVQIPSVFELFAGLDSVTCDNGTVLPAYVPLLTAIRLRVSALPDQSSAAPLADLAVALAGVSIDQATNEYVFRDLPFQHLFGTERLYAFRPTWAPDGQRLAFSDGLRVRVWDPDQDSARAVPGTEGGVSAAWSPDGQWIAFGQLVAGDSTALECRYSQGQLSIQARRVEYPILARTIVLIHPDGTGRRELGPGGEPAWTPDGSALYVRRDDGLWRVGLDGAESPLAAAGDAFEPAVSPDGGTLAFTRRQGTSLKRDLWVLDLAPR